MIFRKKAIIEVSGQVERFGVYDDNGDGSMTFLLVLVGDRKIYRVNNWYRPHYAPAEVQAVHPNHVTLTKAGDLVRFSVSDRDPQTAEPWTFVNESMVGAGASASHPRDETIRTN